MESNQLNNQYRTTVLDSTQSYCLCPKYKTFLTLFQWTFWTIWGYAHHWPISFQSCPVARAKYTSLRPRTTSLMTAPLRTSPQSWICDKTHSRMISDKTRNESTIVKKLHTLARCTDSVFWICIHFSVCFETRIIPNKHSHNSLRFGGESLILLLMFKFFSNMVSNGLLLDSSHLLLEPIDCIRKILIKIRSISLDIVSLLSPLLCALVLVDSL